MSDDVVGIIVLVGVGVFFTFRALRGDATSKAVKQWNAETKLQNADTHLINWLIERGSKTEAIKQVLAHHGSGIEDYALFCNFFQNLGMASGPNRDKAMLSPEVLRYFLENTHRETLNGKMVRVAKDDVAEEVALRIGLCAINGTVP